MPTVINAKTEIANIVGSYRDEAHVAVDVKRKEKGRTMPTLDIQIAKVGRINIKVRRIAFCLPKSYSLDPQYARLIARSKKTRKLLERAYINETLSISNSWGKVGKQLNGAIKAVAK